MNSISYIVLVLLGYGLAPQVAAQATTTAVCTTDLWTSNQEGTSPCLVAAALQGACNGGKFSIPALTPGRQYTGPLAGFATQCACSTVTYSMVAACGACQGQSIDTWTDWITNCTQNQISISSYPLEIPPGTTVPSWAYLDVTTSNVWDSNAANSAHNSGAPDSSASAPTATSSPGSPTSGAGGSSHKSSTPVAAIAGGVAGGVVAILLIGGLIFFLVRRSGNKPNAPSTQYGPAALQDSEKFDPSSGYPANPSPYYVNANQSPPIPQSYDMPLGEPQKLYDPADPSTFPSAKPLTPPNSYPSPAPTNASYPGTVPTPYGGQPHSGQQPPAPYGAPSPYLPEPSSPTRPFSQQTAGSGGFAQVPVTVPQQYGMPHGVGGPSGQGYVGTPEV